MADRPPQLSVPDEDLEPLKNTWWGLEGYMRDHGGRTHEPLVTELVDEGFRLMREGAALDDAGARVEAWEVWMSIAFAQLYNTAMAAWELAYAGYYIQSQMLARLITDYLAVVWYLPNHPEDADKWNATRELPESGDLLRKVFAEDPSIGDKFKDLRGLLNKFAHLDHSGFTILVGEDEDPRTIPIYIGGRFDQRKFQTTARLLFPLFGSIPSAMAKSKAGRDPDWEARVARFVQRIANVMDEYDRRGEAEAQQAKADE